MVGGTLEYLMSSLPNLSFQNTDEARQHVLRLLRNYAGPGAVEWSPIAILDNEAQKFFASNRHCTFPEDQAETYSRSRIPGKQQRSSIGFFRLHV